MRPEKCAAGLSGAEHSFVTHAFVVSSAVAGIKFFGGRFPPLECALVIAAEWTFSLGEGGGGAPLLEMSPLLEGFM